MTMMMTTTTTLKKAVLSLIVVCNVTPFFAKAADLVLEGYALHEALVDDSVYTGTDGVSIHSGDHLHDPCWEHPGQRFTLSAGGGGGGSDTEARGFLVVNDCQVVECTKWTTHEGRTGGKTVIYDLVQQQGNVETWKVTEAAPCSCNGNNNVNDDSFCYSGKFLTVEDYNSNCAITYSPGSIDCATGEFIVVEPSPTWKDKVLGVEGNVAMGLAGVALALLLCCCCYFYACCCGRRRRNKNKDNKKDDSSQGTLRSDEEAPAPKQLAVKKEAAPVVAAAASKEASSKSRGWGMMMFARNKDKKNSSVELASTTPIPEQPTSMRVVKAEPEEAPVQKKEKKGWFFRKGNKDETQPGTQVASRTEKHKHNANNQDVELALGETSQKKGWFFGKSSKITSKVQDEDVATDKDSVQGTTTS